jgi:hypothetical protein
MLFVGAASYATRTGPVVEQLSLGQTGTSQNAR